MGLIYFNAQTIASNLPIELGTGITDGIRSLGFNSIQFHANSSKWDTAWSMDENEYLMLLLKYG